MLEEPRRCRRNCAPNFDGGPENVDDQHFGLEQRLMALPKRSPSLFPAGAHQPAEKVIGLA